MRNLSLLVGWALVVAACATPPTPATTPTPVSTPVAVTRYGNCCAANAHSNHYTYSQPNSDQHSGAAIGCPSLDPTRSAHHNKSSLGRRRLHVCRCASGELHTPAERKSLCVGIYREHGDAPDEDHNPLGASTCQLLNSIDQAGFFDYDEHTYAIDHRTPPMIYGAGNTAISVQAWRSNTIDLYGVDAYIHFQEARDGLDKGDVCIECLSPEFPTILPALRNTDKLLSHFGPADLQPYQSGRVGIWMVPGTNSDKWSAVRWPLKSPSVAELASRMQYAAGNPVAILTGANAVEINRNFGRAISVCGMVVMNGFDIYRVFSLPLLPTEYGYSPLPKVSLSCSPSDGVLPMPSLTAADRVGA